MESRGSSRILEEPLPPSSPKQSLFSTGDPAVTTQTPPTGERKRIDKRSLDYILRSGLAGGLAGCAAKTVVGPLDRVKILFQASNPQFAKYTGSWLGVFTAMRDINKTNGIRGLYRGHSATLLRVFPYAGIKFLAYEQIRARVIRDKSQETSVRRFLSGSLAGITSVFFTYPLEVIRVRLAFETKRDSHSSLSRICQQIYHEQPPQPQTIAGESPIAVASNVVHRVAPKSGLANFYRGFSPTLLGMLPYAGMSFLTHDTIGDLFRHPSLAPYTVLRSTATAPSPPHSGSDNKVSHRSQLNAPAELTSGALAGLVSQTASYPLEVIRRRMQVGGAVGDGHRLTITETARRIWVERGLKGFFVGLTIGYLKVVPMVATSFYVYERGKWMLGI
ncbi:coenzyme A transporter [Elasticomyces elasticus]|uniref:Mitochondrial thiamine pyrophosphate carrier 1 n=1 Tax=Exophiala sideris TaxID=1016849 RepID=A0ABR0J156_9EURO|nr:coenzyme A transporter [Elasticomyces elasticus]KAK5023195.1 coenzyme A transporter [Exophiala sideris]KAK5028567.1 coenzyme A transporter [Exophiala sideris]KAK5052945.1 coenzyme A transporter [Exophiala sideris]KAK5178685.1 coenzyme A transporter [Eurotiomycetes sp. CCFEE 6388]